MRIVFVVNDLASEKAGYTTTRLAHTALSRGHEPWVMGAGDFSYDPSGAICALARTFRGPTPPDPRGWLAALRGEDAVAERLCLDDVDVLMMRYDPADELPQRPWAQSSPILFAQLAAERGTLVVNDPHVLATAINKTYFQQFPEAVRPRTLISRDVREVRDFVRECGGRAVLKPLQGSGGRSVFLARLDDLGNINQMFEAVARDGYVVAQEYLPKAAEGDVRVFVMDGRVLERDGQYAAFRRRNHSGDIRSNVHAGGRVQRASLNKSMFALVNAIRPKLLEDGMFLVGIDVAGDKLMEVNVFSPGGLGSAQAMVDTDFTLPVIEALARKVEAKHAERPTLELTAV